MTVSKKILELVPTIQASLLLKENIKKKKKKDLMKLGVKNIIGANLIRIESDLIALMD